MDRSEFDQWLLDRSKAAGAAVQDGVRVRDVAELRGGLILILADDVWRADNKVQNTLLKRCPEIDRERARPERRSEEYLLVFRRIGVRT